MSSEIVQILPWWSGYLGTPPETDEQEDKTEWGVVIASRASGEDLLFASAEEKPLRWIRVTEFTVDPDTMPFEDEPEAEPASQATQIEGVDEKPAGERTPFGVRRREG